MVLPREFPASVCSILNPNVIEADREHSHFLFYLCMQFFRALFPFVLVASLCTASWQFCDVPARHWAVLKALLSTNRVLTERTQELIRATCTSLSRLSGDFA